MAAANPLDQIILQLYGISMISFFGVLSILAILIFAISALKLSIILVDMIIRLIHQLRSLRMKFKQVISRNLPELRLNEVANHYKIKG